MIDDPQPMQAAMELEYLLVVTTFPTRDDADAAATAMIEGRLAACVQITGPVTSLYRWQGKIEEGREWICTLKTRRDKYDDLEAALRKRHPYQVPEILGFAVDGGYAGYLRWIDQGLDATE